MVGIKDTLDFIYTLIGIIALIFSFVTGMIIYFVGNVKRDLHTNWKEDDGKLMDEMNKLTLRIAVLESGHGHLEARIGEMVAKIDAINSKLDTRFDAIQGLVIKALERD